MLTATTTPTKKREQQGVIIENPKKVISQHEKFATVLSNFSFLMSERARDVGVYKILAHTIQKHERESF